MILDRVSFCARFFDEMNDIIFYTTPQGDVRIDVFFEEETFWLTQKKMAELFGVEVQTINYHLKEILQSGELQEDSVVRKIRITADDGKAYLTNHYNLDAIISVGYRVNSQRATQFRIWATRTLKEYIIKGFVLDDERIEQGGKFGRDYFEELLERIREIRASERRFYQKITDIYAECSIDYDAKGEVTRSFYSTVQNKLHWAITGQTAAELIAGPADAEKPNMGLTTWKHAPKGKIQRSDVVVAKNYLQEDELSQLNRIVSMYLDFAELQAERKVPMRMTDWVERLNAFLQFNQFEILKDGGRVSAEIAKKLAVTEFEKFRVRQDQEFLSDFDREVQRLARSKETGRSDPGS